MHTSCGTHLQSLAELQLIVFHPTSERIRGGTNTRLFWQAGQRAIKQLGSSLCVDKAVTGLLNCAAEQHADAVQALQVDLKLTTKVAATLWKELTPVLAKEVAARIMDAQRLGKLVVVWHREDATAGTLQSVVGAVCEEMEKANSDHQEAATPWMLVACCGERKQGGSLVVAASDEKLMSSGDEASPLSRVLAIVPARGAYNAKLRRWQGKTLGAWPAAKVMMSMESI